MSSKSEVVCETCGTKFERRTAEANRSKRLGRKIYCNNTCSANAITNLKRLEVLRKEHPNNLNTGGNFRKSDEFTPFRWYLRKIKQRNNHECNIDLIYLKDLWELQHGICILSNQPLQLRGYPASSKLEIYHASIDRIDSSKGYIKGNIRYISVMANLAKNKWTDKELIELCKAIALHNPN